MMSVHTECPNCGMPFDIPTDADRCYCDCGESWDIVETVE